MPPRLRAWIVTLLFASACTSFRDPDERGSDGAVDAPSEAAVAVDAHLDAPPVPCSVGEDCDDGLYCNGRDSCSAEGLCVHSGSPCIGAACDETTDLCGTCTMGGATCCGADAQPCCTDPSMGLCAEGLACISGVCSACGGAGQACCLDAAGMPSCDAGLVCSADGRCSN